MNSFEKEYYEAERFWEGDGLLDENNIDRFTKTMALIPGDVQSLADIGCGNGIFVNYLSQKMQNLNIIGIDRSEAALKFVKTNKQLGDINALSVSSHMYDCVTCLEVIEHLPENIFEKALNELCRVSKKYVIISTPYNEILEENYTKCPGCKSQFNADMHLRSFDIPRIQQLLQKQGYSCVSYQTLGETVIYKGHYSFRKIFYPSQFKKWRSPICPICGYQAVQEQTDITNTGFTKQNTKSRSLISYLAVLPKLFWPKQKKYYWILALYQKQ